MNEKPNIILFITHDQGQFLGCYNTPQTPNSLNTPNLDKLAENGVRFTNHFCTAPQCSPSRGSIQTSLYPHQNGLMGLVNRGWNLPVENITLPKFLKNKGYSTHLIGVQHEALKPVTLGYDTMSERFFSKKGVEILFNYNCKYVEDHFVRFLKEHKNDDKPLYLSIGVEEVHRPFKIWGDPVDPSTVKVPPFLPNHDIIKKELSEFYGAINNVDVTIGKIINMLQETSLNENTLFIFTTDHGSAFPRAKCTLYDPGIRTALIMHKDDSELFSGGKVIKSLLSNIDLLPTILELIGAKIPDDIEGKSFLSILRGEKNAIRKEIFIEKTFHETYDPIRGIRTQRYKYIRNFEKLETLYQIPAPVLMAPSGKLMKDIYNTPRLDEELYDLKIDQNETNNIIQNPEYADIAENLRERLNLWLKTTNDPILNGRIYPQPQVGYKKK
ncbi:MAG: sulfatase [Promethearchaeota archaeon]